MKHFGWWCPKNIPVAKLATTRKCWSPDGMSSSRWLLGYQLARAQILTTYFHQITRIVVATVANRITRDILSYQMYSAVWSLLDGVVPVIPAPPPPSITRGAQHVTSTQINPTTGNHKQCIRKVTFSVWGLILIPYSLFWQVKCAWQFLPLF